MPTQALDNAFAAEGSPLLLPGGALLADAGEAVAALYRLTAGRLAEVEPTVEGGGRLLTVHRPGALIGGAQLLGDGLHHTTITALRDSELQAIPAARAAVLLGERPALLAEVARAALARLRTAPSPQQRRSSILGFVAIADSVALRDLVERLAIAMRALGAEVAVLGAEADDSSPAYLHALEVEHDFVLMAAERKDVDFATYSGRQIDRLILVADAETPLPEGPIGFATAAIRNQRLLDVIRVHPADSGRPQGSDPWLDAVPASRLFQIRQGDGPDLARLARIYTGNSVGLALSGGGARAYAHIGVARALAELGIPIDFVAGTSMGAVIAAGLAMGWEGPEMDRRIHAAFVDSSPLSDIAFPILAMTRGRMVDHRLETHFGDVQISDLWRPFTCVSTDLTVGGMRVHRRGSLRRALRASLSLPGVLPPVVEDGHVLVDGSLVRNLPVDLVREQHDGVTIGVDVSSADGLQPDDLLLKPSGWRWLASGAWLRGPPIVSVLIRSATMPSVTATALVRDDVVKITPRVSGVGLQDWKAYEMAADAGYRAAMALADQLSGLRR
ncbi:patatin-like phospholipase family protein [Phenylobacterium sp.]|uniref:patatin-like phospholipase family protein n=1 Tax=Phenylobacterium sp. TaxID=1871053 RepID=UPI0027186A3E|nr:patatin-like phospholipase family protein [Phenylobacterium sp.]MDO8378582.1 patatin-like phospholipase family protein [Phenylobacterium sp.]